jgi:hypothetical protein
MEQRRGNGAEGARRQKVRTPDSRTAAMRKGRGGEEGGGKGAGRGGRGRMTGRNPKFPVPKQIPPIYPAQGNINVSGTGAVQGPPDLI